MALLELGKLAKQAIVLGVADLGRVLDIVEPVVALELGAKPLDALLRTVHEKRRSASGLPGSMPRPTSRRHTTSSCAPMAASARSSSSRPRSSTSRPPGDCAS